MPACDKKYIHTYIRRSINDCCILYPEFLRIPSKIKNLSRDDVGSEMSAVEVTRANMVWTDLTWVCKSVCPAFDSRAEGLSLSKVATCKVPMLKKRVHTELSMHCWHFSTF